MQCIITEKQSNQIKRYDDTKKRAHELQIVRLINGEPSQRQASGTNQRIKANVRAVIKSEALPTVVQLKRKP